MGISEKLEVVTLEKEGSFAWLPSPAVLWGFFRGDITPILPFTSCLAFLKTFIYLAVSGLCCHMWALHLGIQDILLWQVSFCNYSKRA